MLYKIQSKSLQIIRSERNCFHTKEQSHRRVWWIVWTEYELIQRNVLCLYNIHSCYRCEIKLQCPRYISSVYNRFESTNLFQFMISCRYIYFSWSLSVDSISMLNGFEETYVAYTYISNWKALQIKSFNVKYIQLVLFVLTKEGKNQCSVGIFSSLSTAWHHFWVHLFCCLQCRYSSTW